MSDLYITLNKDGCGEIEEKKSKAEVSGKPKEMMVSRKTKCLC